MERRGAEIVRADAIEVAVVEPGRAGRHALPTGASFAPRARVIAGATVGDTREVDLAPVCWVTIAIVPVQLTAVDTPVRQAEGALTRARSAHDPAGAAMVRRREVGLTAVVGVSIAVPTAYAKADQATSDSVTCLERFGTSETAVTATTTRRRRPQI